MGAIQDRTQEHLGTSDKAISAYRRLLRQALEQSGKGEKPMMVLDPGAAAKITGPACVDGIGPAADWQGYWQRTERGAARDEKLGEWALQPVDGRWPPRNRTPRRASSSATACGPPNRRAPAKAVAQKIKKHKLELVRFSFADQHGVLRGKTLVAEDALGADAQRRHHDDDAAGQGHRAQDRWPVFTPGGGFGMAEMQGAGDFVMVADPATFRVLPWAPKRPAGCCATSISPTASRCRSRPGGFCATRCSGSPQPASIISPASRSSFICSRSRTRG